MHRIYNFSAGPATLPEAVLAQVRDELLDWQGTGASIMEISHRGKIFESVAAEAENNLRDLLQIPANYRVLFLQGGGRLQFAMVPMNLLGKYKKAAYANTGFWSQAAIAEASRYTKVHQTWQASEDAAYFYYVSNETIDGLEFFDIPSSPVPLISDMSSDFLSRRIDVSKFGLIFATAQKNIGPSGLTVVIIREDLLAREPLPETPTMLRYAVHAENHSLYNTPPTFAWYVAGLIFKWIKALGGLEHMEEITKRKAALLYKCIDDSDFYHNTVDPKYRSRMNVVFTLKEPQYQDEFLKEAEKHGLYYLKGHRAVGGLRASIYIGMPEEGVNALINFMQDFARQKRKCN